MEMGGEDAGRLEGHFLFFSLWVFFFFFFVFFVVLLFCSLLRYGIDSKGGILFRGRWKDDGDGSSARAFNAWARDYAYITCIVFSPTSVSAAIFWSSAIS